jgi:CubicO group peptidase (beta-lactamase class C family)
MRKLLLVALALVAAPLFADDQLDKAIDGILTKTGAPSASVAIVRDGKIASVKAYGLARLDWPMQATPQMRYAIGSISKQFTAAAVLMLAEQGKLSLDDKVARWMPELTRAKDVSIRQLLSMTSGYQDFWPQDYVMPEMVAPTTAQRIADTWAKKPLDFEPGTKWQYSNTNYTIAGAIVERVAGMPLIEFLRQHIFTPLQMTSVYDVDAAPLPGSSPERYSRYALGPLRRAPKEGKGWLFAAGELAMTAQDLAKWDISMIDESVLKPASYREMERETLLAGGTGTRYGLGVSVGMADGRRVVSHNGEVSGFTAQNNIYPDDRAAIVVLTNLDATTASDQIATKIAQTLFATADAGAEAATAQARRIFAGLQKGEIDRALFTPNANAYFSALALKDFAASLGPLGTPQEFVQTTQSLRGGMTLRRYRVKFPNKTLRAWTFAMPDGKLEQFMVAAVE